MASSGHLQRRVLGQSEPSRRVVEAPLVSPVEAQAL